MCIPIFYVFIFRYNYTRLFYDKKLRSVCQYKSYCDIKTNILIIQFYFLSLNLIS